MASAVARVYNGGLEAEPPAGCRGRTPGQGFRGRSPPPEAESLLVLVWKQSPQQGAGAEPLVRGSGGEAPPEAESLLVFGRSMEAANCPVFYNLETRINQIFVLFLQKNHGWPRNWGASHKTKTATGGKAVSSPSRFGAKPQPIRNLVHFSHKIWHLVATVLIIFLKVTWPKLVQAV